MKASSVFWCAWLARPEYKEPGHENWHIPSWPVSDLQDTQLVLQFKTGASAGPSLPPAPHQPHPANIPTQISRPRYDLWWAPQEFLEEFQKWLRIPSF